MTGLVGYKPFTIKQNYIHAGNKVYPLYEDPSNTSNIPNFTLLGDKKLEQMRIKKTTLYLYLFFILVFDLTVKGLLQIGIIFNLSYNAVNIIIWYMLLPLLWAAILDYKLHQVLFAPIWLLLCLGCIFIQRKKLNLFCNTLFRLSQEFIYSFGIYCLWSVIICLLVPIGITAVLLLC